MNLTQNLVLAAIIALFAVLEIASGRHREFHATADDTKLEPSCSSRSSRSRSR